jgi:quercetin dioxygenase-like cupin family protein
MVLPGCARAFRYPHENSMIDKSEPQDRLRTPPVERFAGDTHLFDLHAELAALRSEPHNSQDGHRQITILHQAPVAHVLFSFKPGGKLDEHSTNGLVAIHVLEGQLMVHADGRDNSLTAGHVLYLKPNVPHDVRAVEESAMLLTIHME